jgi:ribosomal protein S18 acetylase RimI-like enzyme
MNPAFARKIEEASLRAWPSLEIEVIDGWELRAAGGFSKRANSVQPYSPSARSLSDKIDRCETWYESRGLPVVFRLTPFSDTGLDAALQARGYDAVEPTDVLSAPLGKPGTLHDTVRELDLDAWVAHETSMRDRPPESVPLLRGILECCGQRRFLGALTPAAGSEPVACGLAVLDHDLVGLFNLVTAKPHRRRGYGMALTSSLLAWGVAQGARNAYLQVVRTNLQARALYQKLGFTDAYAYWYRVRPV